jgi:Glycosyl hydrolases family 28
VPCQNVVVENCNFANGHGGITIGSEMTGGVKNVYARDLTMNSANLQAGHRIKTNTPPHPGRPPAAPAPPACPRPDIWSQDDSGF